MPGITEVSRDAQEVRARSGNQVRLRCLIEDQGEANHVPLPNMADEPGKKTTDLSGIAADDFLASAAGITADKGELSSYLDSRQPSNLNRDKGAAGGGGGGESGPRHGGVPVGLGGPGALPKVGK